MTRRRFSVACLGAVALLYAGCEHEPDVVANISEIGQADGGTPPASSGSGGSAAGSGRSSGSAAGSGGMGGTPVGPVGSGMAGSNAGTSGSGTSAGRGGSGEAGDAGTIGGGGGEDTQDGGTVSIPACEFRFAGVDEVVEDGCVLEPDTYKFAGFLLSLPTDPPTPESGPPLWCLITGVKVYYDGMQWVLCEDVCAAAREWLADREELHGCPNGEPDPGVADRDPGSGRGGSPDTGRAGTGGAGGSGAGNDARDAGTDS